MITLKANGKFYHNDPNWKGREKLVEVASDLLPHLNDVFEVEEGVIFGQLMSHIFQHWQSYDMVFSSQLGHYSLGLWRDEFNKPAPDPLANDFVHLEVMHANVEINASGPSKHNINDVDIYNEFHGWGAWEKHPDGGASMGGIAVEYVALNELKNYPFKLKKEIIFTDANTYKELCKMEEEFTVYEVISTILYEISWAGAPALRDERWKNLMHDLEKAKSSKTLTSNDIQKFPTPEDFFKKLEKDNKNKK